MKKLHYYLLIVTLAICSINFSCKKKSDSNPSTTVEYRITPMNNYFTQIIVDSVGAKVIIYDPSQFINGSKSISISTKPFLASISAEINNSTVSSIKYTLTILVDGQVKQLVQVNAPPFATSTSEADYTVQ